MAAVNSKNDMSTVVTNLNGATENGTRIAKKGDGMDKDAFFKILAAELSNQDPTNTKDSTAYVAQLAQFASLEQMANLNSTMNFSSAAGYVGKKVDLNVTDDDGKLLSGIVKNVSKNGDIIKLNVMSPSGEKTVNLSDVIGVSKEQNQDIASTAVLIGSNVKILSSDGSGDVYQGVVKSVSKTDTEVKLKIQVAAKELNREMVLKVGEAENNPVIKGVFTGSCDTSIEVKYNSLNKGYDYKISPNTEWSPMNNNFIEYEGLRITKPSQHPEKDASWSALVKPASVTNTEIKEIPASNLIEVVGV